MYFKLKISKSSRARTTSYRSHQTLLAHMKTSDIIIADLFFSIRTFSDGIKEHSIYFVNKFRDDEMMKKNYTMTSFQ